MVLGLVIADQVYIEVGGQELIITEGTGSKHGRGSLHYVGLAADLRTRFWKNSPETLQAVADALRERLGDEFDVVVEATHIHIEYQPK